ncbi:MAG: DUF4851 domain-containing protein [Bilophila sp.]
MLRFLIPFLVIALVVVVLMTGKRGLIRGVADDMLVSPARPAVAVAPRAGLTLVDARRADLSPSVQGSALAATSVQLCYALYQRPATTPPDPAKPEARLVALMAVAESPYRWPTEPEAQGLEIIRTLKQELAGYTGVAETFVLPDADDPWSAVAEADAHEADHWRGGSLVRRYTFLLWQSKAKVLLEYREPLPAPDIVPLVDDIPLLAAFEARALKAFVLLNGDTSVEKLPHPKQNLPYPPETVNRRTLTAYLGELWNNQH